MRRRASLPPAVSRPAIILHLSHLSRHTEASSVAVHAVTLEAARLPAHLAGPSRPSQHKPGARPRRDERQLRSTQREGRREVMILRGESKRVGAREGGKEAGRGGGECLLPYSAREAIIIHIVKWFTPISASAGQCGSSGAA